MKQVSINADNIDKKLKPKSAFSGLEMAQHAIYCLKSNSDTYSDTVNIQNS